jgi:ribosomal protein S18 acetylase RimI-like enzyme
MTAIATHLLCLESGARFTARPIRPDDKPALSAFFERLSPESRRRRFLGPKPRLTSRDLAFLTEVDQCAHVALVAVDAEGAIVAVARYAAWADRPGHAELAVAVADDWHGRGLGSALSEALLAHARRTSVVALTGSTLSENVPAQALLRRLGFKRIGASAGVSEYLLALRGAVALPAAA